MNNDTSLRTYLILPVLLAGMLAGSLALSGCRPAGPTVESPAPRGTPAESAPSPEHSGDAAESGAEPAPEVSLTEGGADLIRPERGLDAFAGYRQQLTAELHGTVKGSPYESTQAVTRRVSWGEEAVRVEGSATGSDPVYFFAASLGGYRYTQGSEGAPCRAAPVDLAAEAAASAALNPALRLPPVSGMQEAGSETVAGLAAVHYVFDERSVPHLAGESGQAQGEVWIAEEGGAVLKYELRVDIDSADFSGTRTWSYALSEVDEEQPIALPEICPPVLADLPFLPGAEAVEQRPGFQRYRAPASRAEAVQFYTEELALMGWQALPGSEPEAVDLGGEAAVLAFSQARGEGGRLLVIRLSEQDGALQVIAQSAHTRAPVRVDESGAVTAAPEGGEETEDAELPPAQAGELPDDLPVYPGGTLVSQVDGFSMLQTGDPAADVAAFYTAEMEAAGWSLDTESEFGGMVSQIWSAAGRSLTITIMEQGGSTQVMISAGE